MMTGKDKEAAGRRILVVEDEVLISMLIETMLFDAGYDVVLAHTLPEALEVVDREAVDLAILDLNLKGQKVYPVAEKLAARGTPFIFATGGNGSEVDGFPGSPWIAKPFQEERLLSVVSKVFSQGLP
jgi:DNA-binding response OmpR family regulator